MRIPRLHRVVLLHQWRSSFTHPIPCRGGFTPPSSPPRRRLASQAAEKVLGNLGNLPRCPAFPRFRAVISMILSGYFLLQLAAAFFQRLAFPVLHAGSNFSNRTRFAAAAYNRNCQSTRRRPRNFVFRRPAVLFIHPKIFSTSLRFPWLMANPGSSRSLGDNQFLLRGVSLSYSAMCGTICNSRSLLMNFSAW